MNHTILNNLHIDLGARMGEFGGWNMPIQYEGIIKEHHHTRTSCSIFDICHMGEIEIVGENAERDLNNLLTANISSMSINQVKYSFLLNENGGVIDDLTIYKIDHNRFLLVVNAATTNNDYQWILKNLSNTTIANNLSDEFGKIDIQGPKSRDILQNILNEPIDDIKYFNFKKINNFIVSRTGYTGELGYELYIPTNSTEKWWNMLLNNPLCKPAGLGARDTLRLEMGYPLYGHELTLKSSPVSFSRNSFIDTSKNFIGKNHVLNELDNPSKKIIGLKFESKRAAREGESVFVAAQDMNPHKIGVVTSGSISPSLNKAIAIANVDYDEYKEGDILSVEIRNNIYSAEVCSFPFYKNGSVRGD